MKVNEREFWVHLLGVCVCVHVHALNFYESKNEIYGKLRNKNPK